MVFKGKIPEMMKGTIHRFRKPNESQARFKNKKSTHRHILVKL